VLVILVATLAIIPVMTIDLEASSYAAREVAFAANWLIWAIFVAELAFILTVAGISDRSRQGTHRGDGERRSGTYPAFRFDRSADMCTHCHLTTPRGTHEVCHACAIALRADVRRGLDAIQEYLRWSEVARWLSQEE
jgi:uncharacterized paraquat-inducible protein A